MTAAEIRMSFSQPPRATLRLQLGPDLDFAKLRTILPYVAELGISHLYLSPFLKARPGSTHGYDIVDHNAFNPEIGTAGAFDRLAEEAQALGLGILLDFVPNHMGIGGADNPWWLSVLEWGRASLYAEFFDIDWESPDPRLSGKVLLPFLGAPYGQVLEAGELKLTFEAEAGSFAVWYWEHCLPISPRHYPRILRGALECLEAGRPEAETLLSLMASFGRLEAARRSVRRQAAMRQEADALRHALARLAKNPAVAAAIEAAVAFMNGTPGAPESFSALHDLLERQAYRLAFWQVAADEINYRRFFDINDLAGLRVEREPLFELMHRLVFRLLAEGKLTGLRLDHIDGLHDPKAYLERLQERAAYLTLEAGKEGPVGSGQPLYVLVEKILAPHERLREDWPVAGTTGYDFLNQLNGLFVKVSAERAMTLAYQRFSGRRQSAEEIEREAKRHILTRNLASELMVLSRALHRLAQQNWMTRDFTRNGLREALVELIAFFPVYRTYVSARGVDEADRHYLDWAIGRARKAAVPGDTSIYDFLREVLTLALGRAQGYRRSDVVSAAMRFQQLTSPVMAKAVEDTAFYRYHRLLSLNEVGGQPARFGLPPQVFHRQNEERLRRWPESLLATGSHDHKRGEDVRARLNVLSEMPQRWERLVVRWARLNRSKRAEVDEAPAPGRNIEYLIYQTLLGAWPFGLAPDDEAGLSAFAERLAAYLLKAVREGKERTSWSVPNPPYEQAVENFLRALLDPQRSAGFLADFLPFQQEVALAGALNGLAQTLLKVTLPGVPDFYQGGELWDLSLVDPDNRRPVDFAARAAVLQEIERGRLSAETLLRSWPDGRVKLFLIAKLLKVRRRLPGLFARGAYLPLEPEGAEAERLFAFLRRDEAQELLVVVPRLASALLPAEGPPLPPPAAWAGTFLPLPSDSPRSFRSLLREETLKLPRDGRLSVSELLSRLPVGVYLARLNRPQHQG